MAYSSQGKQSSREDNGDELLDASLYPGYVFLSHGAASLNCIEIHGLLALGYFSFESARPSFSSEYHERLIQATCKPHEVMILRDSYLLYWESSP